MERCDLRLTWPEAEQFWKQLTAAVTGAKGMSADHRLDVAWDGKTYPFSMKEAATLALRLGQEIEAEGERARRAAGASPVAERAVVSRDAQGDIVGMEKTFRY